MPLSDEHLAPARAAANLLYSRGARRVWLFGSLARGIAPDDHSDLDLAVEGIAPSRLRAIAQELAANLASKVDLVDMVTAYPPVRPHILRTRMLLPREDLREANPTSSLVLYDIGGTGNGGAETSVTLSRETSGFLADDASTRQPATAIPPRADAFDRPDAERA